ncbi:MAG: hypothetical protein HQL41_08595, partial [Alphaproteobacteria bacterium]|nr:hypothetical protein [Alphaproteobacteria bacterium]
MRQHTVTFANFLCHFGNANLLDLAEEVVIPAILKSRVRRYGETSYRLHDTKLENLGNDEKPKLALTGQFIKTLSLTRSQIYVDGKGIEKSEASIESAPSVFFVLYLHNHRLVYFAETAFAPDLKAFSATVQRFLLDAHCEYVNKIYKARRSAGEKVTKREIYIETPKPIVSIVPLPSHDDIASFINRYAKLKKIRFKLLKPNADIEGHKLWEDFRSYQSPLMPEVMVVDVYNPNGIPKPAAIGHVSDAAKSGNQIISLSGQDKDGNSVNGNND